MNWFELGSILTGLVGTATVLALARTAWVTFKAQSRLQRSLAERYQKEKLEQVLKEIRNGRGDAKTIDKATRLIAKAVEELPNEEEKKALATGLFQTSLAGRANYADRMIRRSVDEKKVGAA